MDCGLLCLVIMEVTLGGRSRDMINVVIESLTEE